MCFKFKKKTKIEYIVCPLCEGLGILDNFRCPRCDGRKMVEKSEDESKTCGNSGYKLED
jgi:DnaJ-class molecular chaperone